MTPETGGCRDRFGELRNRAEKLAKNRSGPAGRESEDFLALVQELKVHQAELEIQNQELRRAQEELAGLHREYVDLYDLAPCGYLTLNSKGVIDRINLTGVKVLGCNRRRFLGIGFSGLVSTEYSGEYHAALGKAGETGEKVGLELKLLREDDSPLYVWADIQADRDETERVERWRLAFVDISEKVIAEEEKRRLESELQHARKMESVGQLAGGVAHDFNNILSSIMSNAELLLEDLPEKTDLSKKALEIFNASLRGAKLVGKILAFSKRADESQQETQPVRVGDVAREAAELVDAALPSSIRVHCSVESGSRILGDPTQLHQIFLNLLTNAAQATEDCGGTMELRVEDVFFESEYARGAKRLPPGLYVKATVWDDGRGMSADILERIFEPYFTASGKFHNTGMGLAAVQGFVESQGGDVFAESEEGKWTLVTVYLPATDMQVPEAPREEKIPGGDARILLVDDEPSIATATAEQLRRMGYTVTALTSGAEALALFESGPDDFDLVFSDIAMPEMTGDKLAAAMLAIRPDIPVILITGFAKKMSEEKAMRVGAKAFLSKPVDKKELARTVRNVLDSAGRQ